MNLPSQNNMLSSFGGGELCMLGGLYSDQRCVICGKKLIDNKKNAVCCPMQCLERLMFWSLRRWTMKLSEIKNQYTNIQKNKDQFGRNFYILSLKIDNQSFLVGRDFSDIKSAKWFQKMLVKALNRLMKSVEFKKEAK